MSDSDRDEDLLAEQIAYYRARAPEYDEWMLRQGRYNHGDEHTRQWFEEIAVVERALAEAGVGGDVLELACGTGLWTRQLVKGARSVTAVDASPEVIALNRARLGEAAMRVRYVEADIFAWRPAETYDFVFFGFWLSHVPESRFEEFWGVVAAALRPGGRVFFVDNLAAPEATAWDQAVGDGGVVDRRLNDGRRYRIVKVFHDPAALTARLARLGWRAQVRATERFFIHSVLQRG